MDGHEHGFEVWYRRLHPRLASSLTAITGDPQLAADAADEAFVRALERWSRVSTMASKDGWTFRVALNQVRRRNRRTARERSVLARQQFDTETRPPDWSGELWDALGQLSERQRTAIALRYIADLPGSDIAELMGVEPPTVWSTLDAARKRLRESLGEPSNVEKGVHHG